MRTALLWVEGVLAESDNFNKTQPHREGIIFARSFFNSPSSFNLVLASQGQADNVQHWMRAHGMGDLLTYAAESLWGHWQAGSTTEMIRYLTKDNRHDLKLWIDADDDRCQLVHGQFGISTIRPMFSNRSLVWETPPLVSSFAPFTELDDE